MSSHPNVYLAASICPPEGKSDEDFVNEDGELEIENAVYSINTYQSDDTGIPVFEGNVTAYIYITYGWGEFVDLDEFDVQKSMFEGYIKKFCTEHSCTYKLLVGADFY